MALFVTSALLTSWFYLVINVIFDIWLFLYLSSSNYDKFELVVLVLCLGI